MTPVDIEIISARWILPIDQIQPLANQITVLENHAIVVEERCIIAIGPSDELLARYPNASHTALNHHILMPGLVNAHNFTAMSLLKGLTKPQPLPKWLNDIWTIERQWLSESFARDGVTLGIAEMLLSGTTCFSDSYLFPNASASITESLGMRAQIHFPISEQASNWAQNSEEYFEKGLEIADEYRQSALITTGFGPYSANRVSNQSFERIAMLAEEIDRPIHLYLHQHEAEINDSIDKYGLQPIQRLSELGVLSPRTQAIQAGLLDTNSEQLLVESGASVIHCPGASLKLQTACSPSAKLLEQGVNMGLGTDSAACGNTLNLFSQLNLAVMLSAEADIEKPLSCAAALRMATLGGAETLGLDSEIGSLSVGKQADIIAIDTQTPSLQPLQSITRQLVNVGADAPVSHVWVAGQRKVSDGQLVDIDLNAVLAKSDWWKKQLAS